MKTYALSLTKNYVSAWGMVQAVREILQNALDSGSPFIYDFEPQDDGTYTLMVRSEFSQLHAKTLLLGSSSKGGESSSIGQFGEGYKLAMLVLIRNEYGVQIKNAGVQWIPRFSFSEVFDEEVLVVDEHDYPQARGLTFLISRLTDFDVQAIRESCLRMQENVGAMRITKFGDILTDRPGRLYVGGLFVCETDMKFGYNIRPEFIKLERDRETVSNWDLQARTKEMWDATEEWDFIAEMVEAESPDVEYMKYGSEAQVRDACYRLFQKKNPGKVIAKDNEEMEKLVRQGMTVYVVGGNYYANVTRSTSYRKDFKQAFEAEKSPYASLQEFFKTNRSEMNRKAIVAMKQLIKDSEKWKAK